MSNPDPFEQFWSLYPRKVGKGDARKKFSSAIRLAPLETIIAGVMRYRQEVSGRELRYIAHPSTWLHQERWEDEQGANQDGATFSIPDQTDRHAQWRIRLAHYKPGGFWPSTWGPRPGESGCEVPASLLEELKSRAA